MNSLLETYISALSQIIPLDNQEKNDISDALQWITATQELCKPENMEKHLCAVSVLLAKDRKKTFLIDHIKAKMWLPPGGHVEKGEAFTDTVKKELQEELGIEASFISSNAFFLTQTKANDRYGMHTDVTAWFLVEGDEHKNYSVLEKEATEGKWFLIEEVITDKKFPHFLRRAFEKINENYL